MILNALNVASRIDDMKASMNDLNKNYHKKSLFDDKSKQKFKLLCF